MVKRHVGFVLQADKETLQELQSDSDAMQERLQQLGMSCILLYSLVCPASKQIVMEIKWLLMYFDLLRSS